MTEKDLIIIPYSADTNSFNKYKNKSSDLLALTPGAMLSLDCLNVEYKTTEDFYDTELFRGDLNALHEKIETMLSSLDKISEKHVDFPYAYTGNIVYFSRVFANLLYIQKLSLVLRDTYRKIYLLGGTPSRGLSWGDLTYSELRSIPQTAGLQNKLQIFKHILPMELIAGGMTVSSKVPRLVKANAVLKRLPERIGKAVRERRFSFLGRLSVFGLGKTKKKTLFVVQDGYEIGFLRKHMPEFEFVDPVTSLRDSMLSLSSAHHDFSSVCLELSTFLDSNFPKLRPLIESIFLSYHREVVGRLAFFKRSFEELVDCQKPEVFLFSVGNRDVMDRVISYVANKNGIPVIFFQHGGPSIFLNNIFVKHVEKDITTSKTLILNSKVECENSGHDGSQCVALGSIPRYQMMKKRSRTLKKKALYCTSSFPFYNYTSLLFNVTDKFCYQISRDILDVSKKQSLGIDIKLHPVDVNYSFHYFRQLIKYVHHSNVKVIYGIPAESIMKSYGIIILDSLESAVVSYAFSLNVPVILYLKDLSIVNSLVLEDLKKRCYIVHDSDMLREVLEKYVTENLPSKWSLEIVDRYVYPVKDGHPGPNIANFIKSICSD
jgi:hypothetical protein